MKRLRKTGLLLLLAIVCATVSLAWISSRQTAYASNPTTMSFQGKVVNADGTNVADGTTYTFLFKLYTVGSAGTATWSETQTNVTVAGGVFQVNLGSVCPFFTANACNNNTPIDFNANPNQYLGITFNNDAAGEMSPRVQLQSVPFAYNSDKVGGLTASQLVQLSPGSQQTGFLTLSGAGTFGGLINGTSNTTALSLTGSPTNNANTALLQLAGAISGGNISANGGTYIGINEPASGSAGAAADFLNFQNNGTLELKVTSAGAITAASQLTVQSGGLAVTGNSTISGTLGITSLTTTTTINGLTLASAADGFTVAGGTTSRTLTVTAADITIGSTIKPTVAGTLSIQSNGANALNLDAGGAAAINIGAGTSGTGINLGNTTSNPAITFNGSGSFGTTTGINSLNGATNVTGTNTFTVNGGLTTLGGNLTFSGTTARTITGPGTGGLTMTVAAGPLALSTTTSGALSLNSAAALNLTGAAASTWDIGNNTLSLQTTTNGPITTGSGLFTYAGNVVFNGTAARTLTGPSTGGLSVTVATGALSLSTTTSGTLTVSSAGALNLSGGAASTLNVGANSLAVTSSNFTVSTAGAITAATTTNTINGLIVNSGALSGITSLSQTYTTAAATNGQNLSFTNTNSGAGVTVQGINITPTNTTAASSGTNLMNVVNFAAGGALLASDNTNGVNFASATGYTNFIKTPSFILNSAGAISGVTTLTVQTIDATTAYKANGTAGLTTLTCNNSQAIISATIAQGILTGGVCGQDAAISDQRLKTNIVAVDNSTLDNFGKLNVVTFDYNCSLSYWKDTNQTCDPTGQVGVLAQQLMKLFPSLAILGDDGYYRVNYDRLFVYSLKAVSQLAQYLDSQGNAKLHAVTADSININGPLAASSVTAPEGDFSTQVVTPSLVSSGALSIMSGNSSDVTLDTASPSANVNLGTNNALAINLSHVGGVSNVKGALVTDGSADFNGSVNLHFKTPEVSLKIDNTGSTQQVGNAIEVADSSGTGYAKLINSTNFSVGGNGDLSTNGLIESKGGAIQITDPNGTQVIKFDSAGNGSLAGNLNLASANISGGLNIGGDVNIAGLTTFQKLATFIGKTIFRQDVQFDGHITVAKDGAGYATLRITEKSVHIKFSQEYAQPPVVSATVINGQFAPYTTDNVDNKGFDIVLKDPALIDTQFSWTAIGVNDPQTAVNPLPLTP